MRQHVRDVCIAGPYVAINGRRMLPAFLFISTSTTSRCWASWRIGAKTALADAEARLEKEVMFRSTTPLQDRKKQTTVSGDIRLLMYSWRNTGTVKPLCKNDHCLLENCCCRRNFLIKNSSIEKKRRMSTDWSCDCCADGISNIWGLREIYHVRRVSG